METQRGLNNEWLKERVGEAAAMDDAFHKRRQPWITRSQSFSASMPPPTFMEQGCDLDENHKECVGEVAAIQVGWLDWFPNSRETSGLPLFEFENSGTQCIVFSYALSLKFYHNFQDRSLTDSRKMIHLSKWMKNSVG